MASDSFQHFSALPRKTGPKVIKLFTCSTEHEIYPAQKC